MQRTLPVLRLAALRRHVRLFEGPGAALDGILKVDSVDECVLEVTLPRPDWLGLVHMSAVINADAYDSVYDDLPPLCSASDDEV